MFSNAGRILALREERCDGQKNGDNINDTKLRVFVRDLHTTDLCFIVHTKITGDWLNV